MSVETAVAPVVSVIIPTYNRADHLARAVASVCAQTHGSLQCIVVNDAGAEVRQRFADPRVQVVTSGERGGPGGARNVGLTVATGDYVCFLDDDDVLTPKRVEVGLLLAARSRISIVNWASLELTDRGSTRFEGDFRIRLARGHWPGVGQALVRREDCKQFASYRVAEDYEWWLRMAPLAFFSYSDEPLYLIDRHQTPRSGVDRQTHFTSRRAVFEDHKAEFARDRRASEYAMYRIASAALIAGDNRAASIWALRSLKAFPSLRALKVLLRGLQHRHDSTSQRSADETPARPGAS